MPTVIPTDHSKSVRSHCILKHCFHINTLIVLIGTINCMYMYSQAYFVSLYNIYKIHPSNKTPRWKKICRNINASLIPLIAELFLYCYERDFMSDLHKSKRHDLIDMFNDTSRYLDDIFTIDNPEFEKYIPDIYPAKLQLNQTKKLLSWIKYKSYWQWHSYQRLRQTRWLRISYC